MNRVIGVKDNPTARYVMETGAVPAKAFEVVTNGFEIHVSEEPNGIVDTHGDRLESPHPGLMVKLDARGTQKVELSKWMLAAIAIIPALLLVILNYGATAIGWVRNDQSRTAQIQQLQSDVNTMKDDVKTIKETMQKQAVDDAKTTGYKLGMLDAHGAPKEK